jgi:hypothetical protein
VNQSPGPLPSYRPGLSLEYKLPLLIAALLFALVAAGSVLAYQEVRRSSLRAEEERLQRVSGQLADLVLSTLAQRRALERDVFRDRGLTPLLLSAGGAPDPRAVAALKRLQLPTDSGLPVEVWTRDRQVRLRQGKYPRDWTREQIERARQAATFPGSGGYGKFHHVGSRTFYWSALALRDGSGRTLGYLTQLWSVGSPGAARQVERLVGPGTSVYYANADGGPWTTLQSCVR